MPEPHIEKQGNEFRVGLRNDTGAIILCIHAVGSSYWPSGSLTTVLLLPCAPWRGEEVSIESAGSDPPHSCVAFTWHFCFEGTTQRCEESLGLESQGDKGPCVLYLFIFFLTFWPHHLACEILVPWPGIELLPPVVKAQSLNHWTTSEVSPCALEYIHLCVCVCDRLGPLEHGSQGKPTSSPGLQAILRLYLYLWTPTLSQISFCINEDTWGLPWWSMVKTSSNAGVWVWSLVRELGSHMPFGQKNKNMKQKQYCSKFNKDLENGPHQKKKIKKNKWRDLFISHN